MGLKLQPTVSFCLQLRQSCDTLSAETCNINERLPGVQEKFSLCSSKGEEPRLPSQEVWPPNEIFGECFAGGPRIPFCWMYQYVLPIRHLSSSRQGTGTSYSPSDGVGGRVDPFISVNIRPSDLVSGARASIDERKLLAVATSSFSRQKLEPTPVYHPTGPPSGEPDDVYRDLHPLGDPRRVDCTASGTWRRRKLIHGLWWS